MCTLPHHARHNVLPRLWGGVLAYSQNDSLCNLFHIPNKYSVPARPLRSAGQAILSAF